MDLKTLKEKIMNGELTDSDLSALLEKNTSATHATHRGSFLKTMLKGFLEGYTAPNMWRLTLEALLIFFVLVGIVILSYAGRIDAIITAVLIAFLLGFLFGKIK